ncbi:molybdopterin oxidoreductase family protein [soil metagenome]
MTATSTETTRFVRGACPHDCPDTCAVITEVRDGKAVSFKGDPDHPFTQGWLCAKVRPYLDRVYHPERLLHPMRRVGPKGSDVWKRIDWAEAIDEIATSWKEIIAEHGAAAILPYSYSGTLGLVQMGVASERLWNRMGASGLDRTICDVAATTAVRATLGAKWAPDASHLLDSRFILIWGHNPASTNPHVVPFIRQAQRNGAKVVVIDPRRTRTARSADLHLQPRPATDGALALAMLHVIFRDDLQDEAWLEANTIGWRELQERAHDYPPGAVAEITGLPAATIEDLAREFATTTPAVVKFSDGLQRHANGGQTIRALCALPAVTGQIGVRGGGVYYSASDYVHWNAEAVGHRSECPPVPRTINMNRLGAALTGEETAPPVMSLFVFGANPVTSSPNAGLIVEGLMRDDLFTVVHEQFMTDTARYADIVLPATTQLEQFDLHRPYGHRHLQLNQPAIEPRGESKSNWELMQLLAKAMGYDEPWFQQSAEEVVAEIFEASKPSNRVLAGVTLDQLYRDGTAPLTFDAATEVPYADLKFGTPSGKVELYSEKMASFGLDPLPEFQLPDEFSASTLNGDGLIVLSGAAHHFVTSSMANQPDLVRKEGPPSIEINPADAANRGIQDGDEVLVENARGNCRLIAVITEDVPPGVTVAVKGHWGQNSPDGRNINWTTPDVLADLAGQSTFHSNVVSVRPMNPRDA